VIWGVGPVALLPTATGEFSGIQQWGLGPNGVALVQRGPWTVGVLANHLWSVANNGSNANMNATFLQPILTYTPPTAWSFTLNTETTYDWNANQWAVPINLVVSKVTKVGNQLVQLGACRIFPQAQPPLPRSFWVVLSATLGPVPERP
jgi:Na+/proline symporter